MVLVSGTIGDHGTTVMLARSGMMEAGNLRSDCMPLNQLAKAALACGGVRVLRDPTRGGVATTLNEFVENTPWSIVLEEGGLPVSDEVASACDILGLDPLYCANEGKMLVVVSPESRRSCPGRPAQDPRRGTGGSHWPCEPSVPRKSGTENLPRRNPYPGQADRGAASENLLSD